MGGGGQKNLYILLVWGGGQNHFYVIFYKSIFYIRNRAVKWFGRVTFHLRLEGKKRIRMSCFSVTDPFLTTSSYVEKRNEIQKTYRMSCFSVTDPFQTTFYYVEKRNGSYVRIGGRGLKKSYVPLHGGRGGQKLPKSSFVIN